MNVRKVGHAGGRRCGRGKGGEEGEEGEEGEGGGEGFGIHWSPLDNPLTRMDLGFRVYGLAGGFRAGERGGRIEEAGER